jgi:hypothetical protein
MRTQVGTLIVTVTEAETTTIFAVIGHAME